MHLAEMEAGRAGLPVVAINHDGGGGSNVKDLHLEGFNVSVGGRDLIMDGAVTLGIMDLLEEMLLEKQRFLGTWLCMPLIAFAKYCTWSKKWQVMIHQPCNVLLKLILKEPSFWKKKIVSLLNRENWSWRKKRERAMEKLTKMPLD